MPSEHSYVFGQRGIRKCCYSTPCFIHRYFAVGSQMMANQLCNFCDKICKEFLHSFLCGSLLSGDLMSNVSLVALSES